MSSPKRESLKVGTRVQLWPGDTYPKFAKVVEADPFFVTFQITEVHPQEPFYRPGFRVCLPWWRVKVKFIN